MGDLFSKIQGIFTQGAAKGGKLKSGAGSVDAREDLEYINKEVSILKQEEQVKNTEKGVVDYQALAQSEAEIEKAVNSEMQTMLGADFASSLGIKKTVDTEQGAKYSDEDISLENLMALIDDEVDEYDAEGNLVLDADGNPVKSAVNKDAMEKEMAISEMTHAGVPHEMAKGFFESGLNTHKISERMAYMTAPETMVKHGAADNAQNYGSESNIANLMDYLVSDGYLHA